MQETPVLIAGGGPVGLVLARELSWRGISSVVAERNLHTTEFPKMDITNARSMEHFRRLGFAQILRAAGVPDENPFPVIFATAQGAPEITRWALPSPAAMRARIHAQNDGSQPLEPWLRLSQIVFEPIVKRLCEEDPRVTVLSGWRFEGSTQDADGVTSTLVEVATGRTRTLRSTFLAGCDGAGSVVRKQAGIELEGTAGVAELYQIHFRSTATDIFARYGQFWHVFTPPGALIAQNDLDVWTYHAILPPEALEAAASDPAMFLHQVFGAEFPLEILVTSRWRPNLFVAERYRDRCAFLAGDAAHQVIPTGGYGMNTGIGDAVDLGWKLAAVLRGWGGEGLLASYDVERRPVGARNRDASMQHIGIQLGWQNLLHPEVNEDTPAGRACRQEIAAFLAAHDDENLSLGLEMGYRYEGSPIVWPEEGAAPPWSPRDYRPTTWPGSRAPSLFLADGSALFDQFGPGFTLLRLGSEAPSGAALEAAAAARGVPLKVLSVVDPAVCRAYERPLVLVRPDQHVAWRGTAAPADSLAVIDRIRGAAGAA